MYKKIVINTFDAVFKNNQELLQKLLMPTLLICIINFYLSKLIIPIEIRNINDLLIYIEQLTIPLLLLFLLIMLNISIAITTHRITILGSSSVSKLGSKILGIREFKFLLKSILFGIIIFISILTFSFIPIAGIYLAIFISIILLARLSFIYPAIACDEKVSFFDSWKLTKKHTLLILFSIVLFPLVFAISVGLIYSLAIEFLIKLVSPHFNILYSFLNVFITVFSISALSSVYLLIKPRPLNKYIKNVDSSIRETIVKKKKDSYKIIIHDKNKISFDSLKKELENQYNKIGFNEIAYNRNNAYLLKNRDEEESYVSLRHENDEFTIQTNRTQKPILKIIQKKN